MKPNDKVEEKEDQEEGLALAYGPLTQNEYVLASIHNLCTRNSEQEYTISRLRLNLAQCETVIASQQEGFDTLQAAAEDLCRLCTTTRAVTSS